MESVERMAQDQISSFDLTEEQWEDEIQKLWSSLSSLTLKDTNFERGQMDCWMMVRTLTSQVRIFVDTQLRRLRFSMNPSTSLSEVSEQFKKYLKKIEHLQTLIEDVQQITENTSSSILQCLEQLKTLQILLIVNMIVPEQQPPKLIQMSSRFNTSLRCLTSTWPTTLLSQNVVYLIGHENKINNQNKIDNLKVQFEIVTIKEMRRLYFEGWNNNEPSIQVNFPSENLKQNLKSNIGQISDKNNCSIIQFKRSAIQQLRLTRSKEMNYLGYYENDSEDLTSNEKYCLKYVTHLDIQGKLHEISCCSAPFIYFTKASQEPRVQSQVFWDSYFLDLQSDIPFKIIEQVPLHLLCTALASYFKTELATEITRELTRLNLTALAFMFREYGNNVDTNENECIVERNKFVGIQSFQHNLQKPNNWEIFQGIVQLFQNYKEVQEIWNRGLMIGFVDRQVVENVLKRQEPGTFLLRFSQSQVGGITLSFLGTSKNVWHVAYTFNDLQVLSLSERIRNESRLSKVYCLDQLDGEYIINKTEAFPATTSSPVVGPQTQTLPRAGYASTTLVQLLQFPE